MTERVSASPDSSPASSMRGALADSIDEILGALAAVGSGDLEHRIEPRYDESHPVGALALSVNAMVEALADARTRSAAYARDLGEKVSAIERQQLAIRELSTPIIEVWEGVLCVPVVGMLDSVRTSEMTNALLSSIVEKRVVCAIVDITGIRTMDTRAVDHFLRMARAVRLLGARCVLSGVHPNISQTIVHMGLDLEGIETHRTMRDALRQHARTTLRQTTSANRERLQEEPMDTVRRRSHSNPPRATGSRA